MRIRTNVLNNNQGATTRGEESSNKRDNGSSKRRQPVEAKDTPGMYRIYISFNEGKVGRITYNSLDKPVVTGKTFDPQRTYLRPNVLEVVVETLRSFENKPFKKLKMPAVMFVPNSFLDVVKQENYKIWMMTGAFSTDGKPVDEEELALWEEFDKLRCKYSRVLMLREIGENSRTERQAKDELDALDIKYTRKSWDRVKIEDETIVEEEEDDTTIANATSKITKDVLNSELNKELQKALAEGNQEKALEIVTKMATA
jgi:hypothetical protein